jgi:cyclopropane fatty-acyl-phospholipid synthase-like methyltransferase
VGNYNKTQLYIDKATDRGIVHRDYLAHTLRWTHVLKHARMGMKILDVGCGVNMPLAMTLYTNRYKPEIYCGLDIREDFQPPAEFPFPLDLRGGFDITSEEKWRELGTRQWDLVTCLEVIEHMDKTHGQLLLDNLSLLPTDTTIFLSTPCYNGSKAANHIYEWEYEELRDELQDAFTVEEHFGTFASQRDILPVASEAERTVFNDLKRYYDSNLLAILLAPNHPSASRNCIWRLRTQ